MAVGPSQWFPRVMVVVTERELAAILDHCRSLIDAADEFAQAARGRAGKAALATAEWEGEFRETFVRRFDHEAEDLADRVSGLRADADSWAMAWADTVNELNRQRRQAAIDRISDTRGAGERFVDFFVGDDSSEQVRAVDPVPVPTAATRFAATGGLEWF